VESGAVGSSLVLDHLVQILFVQTLRAHAEQTARPAGRLGANNNDDRRWHPPNPVHAVLRGGRAQGGRGRRSRESGRCWAGLGVETGAGPANSLSFTSGGRTTYRFVAHKIITD
jgi:hypothetical protein